jgi:hypothetical protein
MAKKCTCEDWEVNIPLANAGFCIMSVHGMGGYRGKPFAHCPWCGSVLLELPESED